MRFVGALREVSVEPVVAAYMLCLYYWIPAINSLYLYKVCRTVFHYNATLCTSLVTTRYDYNNTEVKEAEDKVSQETSRWLFYQTVVFVLPSITVSLLMGVYADRKGRRLPLMMPLIGQLCGSAFYLVMVKMESIHVSYMLLAPILTGLSGGYAVLVMASYSHVASVASESSRTVRITILEASLSVGTFLGSFTVGSVLDRNPDDPTIGWITGFSCIISLMAITIVYSFIRMSYAPLPSPNQPPIRCQRGMVFRTACSGFPSYLQLTLAAIFTLWVTGLGKFDVLYNFTQRMKLTRGQYGYYTGIDAAVGAVSGVVSTYILKNRLGWHDASVAMLGISSGIFCMLTLAASGFSSPASKAFAILWWLSPLLGMFQLIGPTALRSIASHLVVKAEQGQLFAFISASDGMLQLITSGIYQYALWPVTEEPFPSACFFLSAALSCVSLLLTFAVKCLKADRNDEPLLHSIEDSAMSEDA